MRMYAHDVCRRMYEQEIIKESWLQESWLQKSLSACSEQQAVNSEW